tara:strand:+ start:1870 stop:2625 length:756 start_codon:yes stop_codon:yes gene_type:complete
MPYLGYLLAQAIKAGDTIATALTNATNFVTKVGGSVVDLSPSVEPLKSPTTGSADFNGSNEYVNLNQTLVPAGADDFTVMCWVYRNSNNIGYEEIISQWIAANGNNSFFLGFYNSNVRFSDNWNNVTVSGAGDLNKWFHLCGVNHGGSNAYIYLDGDLKATRGSALTYTGQADAFIGKQGVLNSEYFSGNLANVAIWNRALTSDEINSVMNKSYDDLNASETKGLVSWYALDDISGTTVPDSHGNYNGTAN